MPAIAKYTETLYKEFLQKNTMFSKICLSILFSCDKVLPLFILEKAEGFLFSACLDFCRPVVNRYQKSAFDFALIIGLLR